MQILSRATWGAAPPKSTTPFSTVAGWIVHWVGGSGMNAQPTLNQSLALMLALQHQAMQGLHGDVYNDFEYNFAVDPAGRIFEGRGWLNQSGANGTTTTNEHYWSVVYLAGPGVPLTASAKQALLWLTQEGARRQPACAVVLPHDHVPGDSTGCPGPDCTPFAATLNAHLHDPQIPVPPPAPKVSPMYNPPIDIKSPVVASLNCPTGGAWTLSSDGSIRAWGTAPYKGGANGQPYWGTRTASRLETNGAGYTIIATTGERYNFP